MMTENEEDDVIVIPFSVFSAVVPLDVTKNRMHTLALELRQNFTCFGQGFKEIRSNSSWAASKKVVTPPPRRISLLPDEKKRFVTLLNKLTHQNIDVLFTKYTDTFSADHISMYIETLFEYIQRSTDFCPIYCRFIGLLHSRFSLPTTEIIQRIATTFFTERQWILPSDYRDGSAAEVYDEFCDYQKWKRGIFSTLQAYVRLIHDRLLPAEWIRVFTHTLLEEIGQETNERATEVYLQQLMECITCKYCPTEAIRRYVHDLAVNEMPPSSLKFKWLDIHESCNKKMTSSGPRRYGQRSKKIVATKK